ncbi:fam-l protein [Plasmodium malariae]|uniref:Fam-l protein n=1 Tax=Plasmodium malariae TaxID=5858 RepID=A0A1D3TDS2_PLAMA|nr:fam-l protein [Plasmodium malariae]SCP03061.1 fam-l protein [Plasmodium malariae]
MYILERKIKIIVLIKIVVFIFLTRICHIKSDVRPFSKSMNEHFELDKKSGTRNYRLLAKYKQDKYSNALGLKEEMTNNGMKKKKDISNNMEGYTGKRKHSNGIPSEFKGNCKSYMKKNKCMFETKNYSYFEKKIFKEMDFMDFLKNNKTISNKSYGKVIRKKCVLLFVLPLLMFFLLSVLPIVDLSWGLIDGNKGLWDAIGFSKILKECGKSGWLKAVYGSLKEAKEFWRSIGDASENISELNVLGRLFRILIYGLPFLILGITFISRIVYYHKKVKKYERIKFRQR